MSKSYNKIIEKIRVTDEMRTRILNNIQSKNTSYKIKFFNLTSKKFFPFVTVSFLILIVTSVTLKNIITVKNESLNMNPLTSYIPHEEVSSASELSLKAGFEINDIKYIPFKINEVTYSLYFGNLAQIEYIGTDNKLLLRKSYENIDNSGDYTEYPEVIIKEINNISITLKGENNLYNLVTWNINGYSYSLNFEKALEFDVIISIIENIN